MNSTSLFKAGEMRPIHINKGQWSTADPPNILMLVCHRIGVRAMGRLHFSRAEEYKKNRAKTQRRKEKTPSRGTKFTSSGSCLCGSGTTMDMATHHKILGGLYEAKNVPVDLIIWLWDRPGRDFVGLLVPR